MKYDCDSRISPLKVASMNTRCPSSRLISQYLRTSNHESETKGGF